MFVKSNFKLLALLILVLPISSCKDNAPVPDSVPTIEFIEYELIQNDTFINVTFSFEDLNGDLGLDTNDIQYPFAFGDPFHYNLQITYLEKKDGQYDTVRKPSGDIFNISERFPIIEPIGKSKKIIGKLKFRSKLIEPVLNIKPDTFKLDFNIVDRNLNKSNKVSTGEISIQ